MKKYDSQIYMTVLFCITFIWVAYIICPEKELVEIKRTVFCKNILKDQKMKNLYPGGYKFCKEVEDWTVGT